MLFHAVAESIAADPEEPGGAGLVAVRLRKSLGEQTSFVIFERPEFRGRSRLDGNRGVALSTADELGKIADVDHRTHDHDASVTDDIFEFANVSRPIVLAEQQMGSIGEPGDGLAELAGKASHKMSSQQRQVSIAFEQAGGLELDHRKAIEKIFAELLGGDHGAEIAMRRGDHADVDLTGLQRTEALDLLILQGAEQFALRRQGHVANFVEKEGAVVGVLKQADLILGRPGKGTFDVAEQLAFKQRFDEGRTVQRNERTLGARAEVMQGFGDQLLTGSGLPGHEDSSVVRRHALNLRIEMPHGRTVAHHAGEDGVLSDVLFQFQGGKPGAMPGKQWGQASPQGVRSDGFIEIVSCSLADGLDRGFGGIERRHQDDVDGWVELDDAFEQLHAGEPGHDDIGEHDLRLAVEDELEAKLRISETMQLQVIAAQGRLHQFQAGRTIVDNRDGDWPEPSHLAIVLRGFL